MGVTFVLRHRRVEAEAEIRKSWVGIRVEILKEEIVDVVVILSYFWLSSQV